MTDDSQKLTPAKPVAPRRKLPSNPRMAQPITETTQPSPPVAPEPVIEPVMEQAIDDAPPVEAFTPVQPVLALDLEPAAPVQPVPAPEPARPAATAQPAPADTQPEFDFPKTIRETLARVDQAWTTFRAAAMRFPSERMDERLSEDGWTRKQMLEHIAAWHDLTADRLVKMFNTGAPVPLEQDTDAFNASVARRAIGKTSGEVLKDMDATFNRLRRQLARATDAQLRADDWWLAYVIGGNTYGHYEEHWAEIYTPELAPNARQRR